MRQPLRRGTWCTNGPAPRSPNSVTTKHFTGIKRKIQAELAPAVLFFFFSGVGSGAAQKQRESFARRIELAANPPKKDIQAASCFFFLQLHPQQRRSGLSEEHPDRPTRAPGGPCDLNLFLSSTTK
ncbi:hypothetical protein HDV63DRAFT_113740 [Trichoderma sp. SZMC 28014]